MEIPGNAMESSEESRSKCSATDEGLSSRVMTDIVWHPMPRAESSPRRRSHGSQLYNLFHSSRTSGEFTAWRSDILWFVPAEYIRYKGESRTGQHNNLKL